MSYSFRGFEIPDHTLAGLTRYIKFGCPVGSFLRAVLENDLSGACGCADQEHLANLPAVVAYLYNEAPSQCHGSREKVLAWLAKHR